MALATVKEVKEYFGMSMAEFKAEWMSGGGLTDEDKRQLREGIGNGTLTY